MNALKKGYSTFKRKVKSSTSKNRPSDNNAPSINNISEQQVPNTNNDDSSPIPHSIYDSEQISQDTINLYTTMRMLDHLPKYHGDKINEDYDVFIECFETRTASLNISEDVKLDLLRMCMKEKASDYFNMVESTTPFNWQAITEELRKIISKAHVAEVTLQTVNERRQQEGENIETFAADIRKLVNKFFTNFRGYNEKLREKQMIRQFSRGLKQPLRKIIKRKTFSTLAEAVECAITIQSELYPSNL